MKNRTLIEYAHHNKDVVLIILHIADKFFESRGFF